MGHDRDLDSPIPWRRSLRTAQERRGAQLRRRRRTLRARAGLTLAVAGSALAAAGALAQDPPPPSGGTAPQSSAKGGTVAAVQRALGLPADGVYGPRTRAAVRRFQRRHGLTVDGVVGPQTLAELGISTEPDDEAAAEPASTTGAAAPSGAASATLERIARCESGGDPRAVSADGRYRGKYQFDRATWQRLGGTGDPAAATEAEQDRRAAKLLAERGTSPWPNCG
ncbi:MAG TPA: peptidoglycan-binding protein [Solirubrobacteraceae bacterium]|nr:peptidoglycan-binding protein [Solirubrobacteraceae bacterium]